MQFGAVQNNFSANCLTNICFQIYRSKCFACRGINYSNRRTSNSPLQCNKCNKMKVKSITEPNKDV